jgi:hypothetical protein
MKKQPKQGVNYGICNRHSNFSSFIHGYSSIKKRCLEEKMNPDDADQLFKFFVLMGHIGAFFISAMQYGAAWLAILHGALGWFYIVYLLIEMLVKLIHSSF